MLFLEERWGINGYGLALEEFVLFSESLELQDFPLVSSWYNFILERFRLCME